MAPTPAWRRTRSAGRSTQPGSTSTVSLVPPGLLNFQSVTIFFPIKLTLKQNKFSFKQVMEHVSLEYHTCITIFFRKFAKQRKIKSPVGWGGEYLFFLLPCCSLKWRLCLHGLEQTPQLFFFRCRSASRPADPVRPGGGVRGDPGHLPGVRVPHPEHHLAERYVRAVVPQYGKSERGENGPPVRNNKKKNRKTHVFP